MAKRPRPKPLEVAQAQTKCIGTFHTHCSKNPSPYFIGMRLHWLTSAVQELKLAADWPQTPSVEGSSYTNNTPLQPTRHGETSPCVYINKGDCWYYWRQTLCHQCRCSKVPRPFTKIRQNAVPLPFGWLSADMHRITAV